MKKLKHLKLHSAVVLQEKEMKAVRGGDGFMGCEHSVVMPGLCSGPCTSGGRMGFCERKRDGGIPTHPISCECVIPHYDGYDYSYPYPYYSYGYG